MTNQCGSITLKAFGQTDTGLVRSSNEDALILADLSAQKMWDGASAASWTVPERGVLLAVSDGMGGAKAGEVASAMSLDALYRGMLDRSKEDEEDAERLQRVVELANREVRAAATTPDKKGMGATLTAVFLCGGVAYIAEIGDSRAYLIRQGRICQVTHDQSYVQMLVDAGAITQEEAEQSPKKNIIMQVMGQPKDVVVALGRMDLRQGDRLLLCSDGLSNELDADTIRRLAAPPAEIDAACAALINAAKQAGGHDNITVLLAEMGGDGLRTPGDKDCVDAVETVQEYKP